MNQFHLIVILCAASLVACDAHEDVAATSVAGPPKMDKPSADQRHFSGEVSQRLGAGSYTYMLVETTSGAQRWVVTVGSGHQVGTSVNVRAMGVRDAFKSRRLGRTFERLAFAIVNTQD